MKIEVLGTRGNIVPSALRHARHTGLLIDDQLLLDLGERAYLARGPRWIVITHLHPDHAAGLEEAAQRRIPTYAPEATAGVTVFPPAATSLGPYTVTPIPVVHSEKVKSFAYVVARQGQALLYTGDLVDIDRRHPALSQGLNLVVTEASYLRRGGLVRKDKVTGRPYGHTGVPDLIALFKEFTRHILLIHFGAWFYTDIPRARRRLRAIGRENGVDVHIGYDGMTLDLAALAVSDDGTSGFRAHRAAANA